MAPTLRANPAMASGKVFVQTTNTAESSAPKYASLVYLRGNIPGEVATQLAGPDKTDPSRIFPPTSSGASYYMTDAGSQWNSGISQGQETLAIVQCIPGQHNWSGAAYAGAVTGTVSQGQLVSGLLLMPDLQMSQIPVPSFLNADSHHISISISAFVDYGGMAKDLSIWRSDSSSNQWQWMAAIPNPSSPSSAVWNDLSVVANSIYSYSVTVDFNWPGGSGAGQLSGTTGIYSSDARGISGLMEASAIQPAIAGKAASPTPLPMQNGWLLYPNPVHGNTFYVAFNPTTMGIYTIQCFSLAGELTETRRGTIQSLSQMDVAIDIPKMASGIYLVRLEIKSSDGSVINMPLKKIAVLK